MILYFNFVYDICFVFEWKEYIDIHKNNLQIHLCLVTTYLSMSFSVIEVMMLGNDKFNE